MRSLIKAQEEQHQLNAAMLQILTDLQRKIDSGRGMTRPEGSKSSTRRKRRTSSGSSNFEESGGYLSSSSHKKKKKRHIGITLEMNLRKLNLLHFMVR